MTGIVAYGSYIPYWRLQRGVITKSLGAGGGKGERAVASFDEDTTSMGVEAGRIALAWRMAMARPPAPEETALAARVLEGARRHFGADPAAAAAFLAAGRGAAVEGEEARDAAAWATLSSLILNLDETISKP